MCLFGQREGHGREGWLLFAGGGGGAPVAEADEASKNLALGFADGDVYNCTRCSFL